MVERTVTIVLFNIRNFNSIADIKISNINFNILRDILFFFFIKKQKVNNIPEDIEIDITNFDIGDTLKLRILKRTIVTVRSTMRMKKQLQWLTL